MGGCVKVSNNPNCLQMLLRLQVLPPVPQIEAVLEAHQVPHAVGVVSSVRILSCSCFASFMQALEVIQPQCVPVCGKRGYCLLCFCRVHQTVCKTAGMLAISVAHCTRSNLLFSNLNFQPSKSQVMDKQVIVEAVEHKMVLNEGSILWLTEQRIPLGIVDEVFGPVKKPYYIVRYNKTSDVPDVASQGVTVGFVQEFANFVLNEAELRKKGYDASGQHDEEISDEDVEFSDDEKEEEAKRLRKQAAKQGHQVGEGVDGGRGGGRGGGGRQKAGGRGGRGRGGRGRFSRSDSMVSKILA